TADDVQVVGGERHGELGRHDRVAAAQHGEGWTSAAAGVDGGEAPHPAGGEDAADLGDPGRQVRPVPEGQGGDDQVEHLVGERQALDAAVNVADGQRGGGDPAGGGPPIHNWRAN